ncbi:MAG: 6-pyruvoyl tetrahydropterin synthase family protein [Phycisphaerae bacterium]
MQLMREVRFMLGLPPGEAGPVLNSWAGWPGGDVIAPFIRLRALVSGPVDGRTGYLCNITHLDHLLRDRAVPHLRRLWSQSHPEPLRACPALTSLWDVVRDHAPGPSTLAALELSATPYQSHRIQRGDPPMLTMTESFEFAASHRLCCRDLADDDNAALFGKCSNPNGHGHNYVVQISVVGQPDDRTGALLDHVSFQRTVKQRVVDHFDHKHLNSDCPEFADLNPTVENITRVIWERLKNQFAPARLQKVRVYETPKTYAEYAGD